MSINGTGLNNNNLTPAISKMCNKIVKNPVELENFVQIADKIDSNSTQERALLEGVAMQIEKRREQLSAFVSHVKV